MLKFLQTNRYASIFLTFLRVYLGWTWFSGGLGKLSGEGFDATGFLKGAIGKASGDHPAVQGWWASFLENFAFPNVELFNVLVPWGELLVGLGLMIGAVTAFSALMGIIMNFAFLFSGSTSTNPQMVIMGLIIALAGYNAGKYGVDRFLLPYLSKTFKKETNDNIK